MGVTVGEEICFNCRVYIQKSSYYRVRKHNPSNVKACINVSSLFVNMGEPVRIDGEMNNPRTPISICTLYESSCTNAKLALKNNDILNTFSGMQSAAILVRLVGRGYICKLYRDRRCLH
jgi:hypothetical protein